MSGVIPMAQGLLSLAGDMLRRHQNYEASRVLRRVLEMATASPSDVAEANRMLAEMHLRRADYDSARNSLFAAIEKDPHNSECHLLLGRATRATAEAEDEAAALPHFRQAAELAPNDPAKRSAYGLQLVRARRADQGMKMLERAYAEHGGEPNVVSDYAEALLVAERDEDAERVVVEAAQRNGRDPEFQRMRQRFERRVRERVRFGDEPSGLGRRTILPFRSAGGFDSKPRGPRRPAKDSLPADPPKAAPPPGPIVLSDRLTLDEVLERLGRAAVASLYLLLGLSGKTNPRTQRAAVVITLCDPEMLGKLVRELPADSRRLLRTVVRSGGFVPASVLFQNTGPDAPPPDYAQPLLMHGLLFFGSDAAARGKNADRLMACIPVDLLQVLARILRIRLS